MKEKVRPLLLLLALLSGCMGLEGQGRSWRGDPFGSGTTTGSFEASAEWDHQGVAGELSFAASNFSWAVIDVPISQSFRRSDFQLNITQNFGKSRHNLPSVEIGYVGLHEQGEIGEGSWLWSVTHRSEAGPRVFAGGSGVGFGYTLPVEGILDQTQGGEALRSFRVGFLPFDYETLRQSLGSVRPSVRIIFATSPSVATTVVSVSWENTLPSLYWGDASQVAFFSRESFGSDFQAAAGASVAIDMKLSTHLDAGPKLVLFAADDAAVLGRGVAEVVRPDQTRVSVKEALYGEFSDQLGPWRFAVEKNLDATSPEGPWVFVVRLPPRG